MNFISRIRSSISLKITFITILGIFLALTIFGAIVIQRLEDLSQNALDIIEDELYVLANEYYDNYLNGISKNVEQYVHGILNELHVLSGITQTYFDHASEFEDLSKSLNTYPYFRDDLYYSGSWYENRPYEPATLFIPQYMLNENGTIPENIQARIDGTRFLELLLPAFATNGHEKLQAFYQGGQMEELARLSPWYSIGENIYDVYPELNTQPITDTFNPGLADQWTERIQATGGDPEAMKELYRITPPVQDGLTGEIILTFTQPLADENYERYMGGVSFDVPITNVIELVEDVQISENGFAFMAQSNGNIFAINQHGLEVFGLSGDESSTVDAEEGFNRLERFLSDSTYPEVQTLQFSESKEPSFGSMTINDTDYIIITKQVDGYQSWSPERSFYEEHWTLGFVVPEEEIFALYNRTEDAILREQVITTRSIVLSSILVMFALFISIYFTNTRMTSQLNQLAEAVRNIKDQNYDIDIDVHTTDEVGRLSRAFTAMASELHSNFEQLEVQNRQLKSEVSERKRKDRIIDYLENFDAATDLPNKKALLNILKDLPMEKQPSTSLMYIGLDDFRKINEAYSWRFGDQLIQSIAEELQSATQDAMLFKLSGDEFAVLYHTKDLKDLMQKINDIQQCFKQTYTIEDKHLKVTGSIGVSSYPYDSSNPMDILKFATTAMVHAKESHKGSFVFYDDTMNANARNRMELIEALRFAVEHKEFELFYQPIIDMKTKKWNGMEALIRWRSKTLGPIPPSTFIPIAEQTKLILEIGKWVLEEAMRQTAALHKRGHASLYVSINVSIVQIMESDFVKTVKDALAKTNIDPTLVNIEITEGIFIEDLDHVMLVLTGLKKLGISISVDDFGTGYSSLSYINNLPLSKLKVDRAFVQDLSERKGQEITNAIIGLAHNLHLGVVAEGIETEEQEAYLHELECAEGQGYLYGRPMSYSDFEDLLHIRG